MPACPESASRSTGRMKPLTGLMAKAVPALSRAQAVHAASLTLILLEIVFIILLLWLLIRFKSHRYDLQPWRPLLNRHPFGRIAQNYFVNPLRATKPHRLPSGQTRDSVKRRNHSLINL